VSYESANEARNLIYDLRRSLHAIYRRDTEEEVSDYCFKPIDRALRLAADEVGDHPVVQEVRDLFSPEAAAEGRAIRVAEVLPVVDMLDGILSRRVNEMALDEPGAVHRRRADR
jgi:hypothetical protein